MTFESDVMNQEFFGKRDWSFFWGGGFYGEKNSASMYIGWFTCIMHCIRYVCSFRPKTVKPEIFPDMQVLPERVRGSYHYARSKGDQ